MHRQSSRSAANMDAIDCIVNTNDLALENEVQKREYEHRSKSHRDPPAKRPYEYPAPRSTRHSPPSVTRKRQPSPPSISSRSQQRPYPSQRPRRVSSPSLSPPSSHSASRHNRPARPIVPTKRPHSQSESPYERRPPTHRPRPEMPIERTIGDVLTSIPSAEEPKITPKPETNNLSLVSEDESTKTHDFQSNGTKTKESSSITANNKLHSTPTVSVLQPNSNDSLLDMSTIPQECELSLFAKSALSTSNTSSIFPSSINQTTDVLQAIDLLSKYKTMQGTLSNDPQLESCSKDILFIIQKKIKLEKVQLDLLEREMKLRDQELIEREKRSNVKPSEATSSIPSVHSELITITIPNTTEENIQPKSEVSIDPNLVNISPEESVSKSIPAIVDTPKAKTTSDQPAAIAARKSRFSQLTVDPSIFPSQAKPILDLYSEDLDVSSGSILPPMSTDLKITSSSTSRRVEIQSGNNDKSSSSKGSSHDLRLTLVKNRSKQSNNDEHGSDADDPTINDQESTMENKQQSHDYQQQRSVTSGSMEPNIDDTNDKRDVRRHRQQQQPYYSSTNNDSNERSYNHGSTSKYGSNQKRYENNDLRTRMSEQKHPKSSRTTHKNN